MATVPRPVSQRFVDLTRQQGVQNGVFARVDADVLNVRELSATSFAGPSGRTYDAVVDATGAGDYTTIVAAFTAGHKRVFVRSGTYVETANVVVPSTGALVGDTAGGVVIDFGSAAWSVTVDGNGGTVQSAGTVSITSGTNVVTGAGTSFTSLAAGNYILLNGCFYAIADITTDTDLTLVDTYYGQTLAGAAYRAMAMHVGVDIANLTVQNSTAEGLLMRGAIQCSVSSVLVRRCGTPSARLANCGHCMFTGLVVMSSLTGRGAYVFNSASCTFKCCLFKNNVTEGVAIDGGSATQRSEDVLFDACVFANNGTDGLEVLEGRCVTVSSSGAFGNGADGLRSVAGTEAVSVTGCVVRDNVGDGVDLNGPNSVVSGCTVSGNTLQGIRVGANSSVTGCTCDANGANGIVLFATNDDSVVSGCWSANNGADGIQSAADDCVISANRCLGNAGYGVQLLAASDRNAVTGNVLRDNTTGSLLDSGTANSLSNNVV